MDKVTIKVARADDSLMWRIGRDQGASQEMKGLERVIIENDSLFLLRDQDLVDEYMWPDRGDLESGEVWPKPHEAYVLDVFKGNDRMPESHVPWLKWPSTGVAWVTDRSYHEKTDESWVPGKLLKSELEITVFKPPTEGWPALVEAPTVHNVELTSRALLTGIVRDYPQWRQLSTDLSALARRLDNEVYCTGLAKIIADEEVSRGMGGQFGDIKLGAYVMAGRLIFQIERGNVLFSCVGSDDEVPSKMGPQGTYGTYDQIKAMTEDFIARWNELSVSEREARVRPTELSIG